MAGPKLREMSVLNGMRFPPEETRTRARQTRGAHSAIAAGVATLLGLIPAAEAKHGMVKYFAPSTPKCAANTDKVEFPIFYFVTAVLIATVMMGARIRTRPRACPLRRKTADRLPRNSGRRRVPP